MPIFAFPGLAPAVPEIVLVCAAMALLILGVLRGEGSSKLVSWLSVAVLIATLVIAGLLGGERQIGFYGMFVNDAFAVFMKALVLLQRGAPHRALRIPGSGAARHRRDDGHDLGQ
jgi:NADH-quinone oxidoreductase subunit N